MVETLENGELIHRVPAIIGRQTPSGLAYTATVDELAEVVASRRTDAPPSYPVQCFADSSFA